MGYRQSLYQTRAELRFHSHEFCRTPFHDCGDYLIRIYLAQRNVAGNTATQQTISEPGAYQYVYGIHGLLFWRGLCKRGHLVYHHGNDSPYQCLLAHLLASDDRLNAHKIISLIVSLIGLFLIIGMGSDGEPLDWKGITGIVLLLLSIIFQGYSAISVSEDKGKVNPIFLNAVQMFFGGLLIYMVGLGTEGYHSFIGKPSGFYISLGILVFISVFAFSFWFIALQSKGAKVSDINMCRLINPILGAVLSWVMLPDEYPTFSTVAGMIIIVSSLIIYFKGAEISQWLKNKTAKVS